MRRCSVLLLLFNAWAIFGQQGYWFQNSLNYLTLRRAGLCLFLSNLYIANCNL